MPSTYSGNPNSVPKDAIRFLCGDTGPTTFHFSDEEIVYLLQTQANVYMAAAMLCDKLTTTIRNGGLASKSIGGLSESYAQSAIAYYENQAKRLRLMGGGHQMPWSETISQKFSFKQFDFPGVGDPPVVDDDSVADDETL